MPESVTDNVQKQRFELAVDGQIVFSEYRKTGDTYALTHVEAPESLRGTGAAGRLMEGIVALSRAEGFKIVPLCSYAVAWMKRHP